MTMEKRPESITIVNILAIIPIEKSEDIHLDLRRFLKNSDFSLDIHQQMQNHSFSGLRNKVFS